MQKQQKARASRDVAWRVAFVYAALFFVIGCWLPYFAVWLDWRGLRTDEIAVLLSAPLFTRVVFIPIVSFIADRVGDRRLILIVLSWGALAAFLLLWVAQGFWQMFLVMLLLAANWNSVMPLTETVAMTGVRAGVLDYGRVRLWGSLSFIVAALGAGLIVGELGPQAVLPLLMTGGVLTMIGAHLLPRDRDLTRGRGQAAPAVFRPLRLADAFALIRSPLFLLFLAGSSLIYASHMLIYTFGSLHWQSQGFPSGAIGGLWSVGVVAEVVLFAASASILARYSATRMLVVAGVAATLRWGLMAIDPPLWATAILQNLHALSFGAGHLAAMHFVMRAVPEDRAATAQGLYAAVVVGMLGGLVTLASGPLYRALAGEAYGVMALVALVGTVLAYGLMRQWHGGLVVGEEKAKPKKAQPQSAGEGGETWPEA